MIGYGYDPGAALTSNNRFARMLMRQQDAAPPVTQHTQGLAQLARMGLSGWMMGEDQRDYAAANEAMTRGMTQPWINPDTGAATIPQRMPAGQAGPPQMVPTGPAGGAEGAITALQKLGDNPYAQRNLQGLLMQRMDTQAAASVRDEERRHQAGLAEVERKHELTLKGFDPPKRQPFNIAGDEVQDKVWNATTQTWEDSGESYSRWPPRDPAPFWVLDTQSNSLVRKTDAEIAVEPERYTKPPTGMTFASDGKGGFELTTGGSGLGRRATGEAETQTMSLGSRLAQITAIRARFKPEYQEVMTRGGFAWDALSEKWGSVLSPEDQQNLTDFTQSRAASAQMFTDVLKDLSGVAINPTEYKRAEAFLPNPGTGVFDGDSPTQMTAKLDRLESFTRKAMMKYAFITKYGFDINSVDMDEMPSILRQRGNELMARLTGEGMDKIAAKNKVVQMLADEFGLVNY
jgi:hypothetical protein